MSRQINQPINQVRLTNVAVVRMNKGGKRFEIACYRNKVVNYRQGIETDLSEVLQTERVFVNVSKGEFAKAKDMERIFGTTDEERVIQLILEKGDVQISDLERSQQYESMYREIATWISEHCVHPVTQRPYTIPQIRQAMKQSEYAVHPTRSMKKQYLDCFKRIQQLKVLPIERAKMELQITYPSHEATEVEKFLRENQIQPTKTTTTTIKSQGKQMAATLLVNPSHYRGLEDLTKEMEEGRLEILRHVVKREGDTNLEAEMAEKLQQQQQETAAVKDSLVGATRQLTIQEKNRNDVDDHHQDNAGPSGKWKAGQDDNDGDDEANDSFLGTSTSRRKAQKKAQKKSKKAKRREKEEQEERQARIQAEKKRQEERALAMGEQQRRCVEAIDPKTASNGSNSNSDSKSCNTCGGSFATMADYRAHFRSDWHRYNIKLKMKGVAPVSEQEFVLCDSDAFFDDGLM